jgi:hypothetical protein
LASCVRRLFLRFCRRESAIVAHGDVFEMFARDATAGVHVAQRGTATVAQPRGQPADRAHFWAPFVSTLLLVASVGCGDRAGVVDAGDDASQEADTRAPACVGPAACDGTAVRACRDGQLAELIDECAPDRSCSQGRCISMACAEEEGERGSLEGCVFYTFDLDNVDSDDPIATSVLVTNPGQVVATVTLERHAGGDWTPATSVAVAPMRSARLVLDDTHHEGSGAAHEGAFRITSDLPVTAAHIQSDDSLARGSSSTGGTQLLPAHVLGLRYRALTFVQAATPRLLDTPGARGGAGQVVIVGTRDRTMVTVTAPAKSALGPDDGVPAVPSGGQFTLALGDGDLFQLFSEHDDDDLTGMEIKADKPIAVFSGNIATTYGVTATGISSPDLAHEQLLPVTSWGQSYVAAALTPKPGVCDPLLDPPGSSIWAIVADRDDTLVTFSTPTAPGAQLPAPRRINAGESFHVITPGSFTVTGSRPIMVMQGMDCEPTLSSAVSTNPLLTNYRFAVLSNFDTMIGLVRPAGRPVFLDGARIEDSLFEPVAGGFDVARIPLEDCPPEEAVCTHHLEGQFGFTMRGMDVLCSYALTAPTWVPCTDPETPGCLN